MHLLTETRILTQGLWSHPGFGDSGEAFYKAIVHDLPLWALSSVQVDEYDTKSTKRLRVGNLAVRRRVTDSGYAYEFMLEFEMGFDIVSMREFLWHYLILAREADLTGSVTK